MFNNTSKGGRSSALQLPKQSVWLGPCLAVILIVALSVFVLETPGYCQTLDPPEEDCDNYDQKQYNDRINCKAKKLNEKMGDVINMITDIPGDELSDKTKEHLNKLQRRMEKMRERTHEAKGFSKLLATADTTADTFTVTLPCDHGGWYGEHCHDETVEIPNGRPIYALLVSGFHQNKNLDMFHWYNFAKCLQAKGAYVHYAWWNNLLAPYMKKPLHNQNSVPSIEGFPNHDINGFILGLYPPYLPNKAVPAEDYQFQLDAGRHPRQQSRCGYHPRRTQHGWRRGRETGRKYRG